MSKITQSQRKAWANQEQTFIEDSFEVAFGDNAIYKDYSFEEVLKRLRDFSKKAYAFEQFAQEDNLRDIAIAMTDKLVEQGFVKDCIDTDCEDEFGVQDILHEILKNRKGVSNV
jgi:hypothetical protein|tara:strand:- start:98 stop:439 length:342 start_codon:yes stop_codon:yes gene_type:complete